MDQVGELLQAQRGGFKQQRVYNRAQALVMGELFVFGRKTMTQRLVGLGATQQDWSGWYRLLSRPRIDYEQMSERVLSETLPCVPADQLYVVGLDGVQMPRSSRKMPGTAWRRSPRTPVFRLGIDRAQRFVHVAWLTPMTEGYSRAIPLRLLAAFPAKAVPSVEPARKEWEAGAVGLQWVRQQLDEAGRAEQWLLALGDGSYDVNKLWARVPQRTTLLVRCAKNRALFHLPEASSGRGRRRCYGERAPRPDAWPCVKGGWTEQWFPVRGRLIRLRYRVEGPYVVRGGAAQPVYLLVVKGVRVSKGRHQPYYKKPTSWLVSALRSSDQWVLPRPADELLHWLWQRWELEVTHREMKSNFGVGQMQCWSPHGAILSVCWGAWVYAILVLAGYRAWGLTGHTIGPPGRWWPGARRWSFNSLWHGFRRELWQTPDFQAVWSGIADNLWKNDLWQAGLWNAVAGSVRI